MTPIVAFVGPARSGKDTAAQVLCERYQGTAIAFADPIKRFLHACGFTEKAQLWGDQKEVEVRFEKPPMHMPEMLSEALNGWKTPDECARNISFKSWFKSLPNCVTPRHAMQTFGTECVRAWNADLWADFGLYTANLLLVGAYGAYYNRARGVVVTGDPKVKPGDGSPTPSNLVCITDARFRNEVLKVKQLGGLIVKIERPDAQMGLSERAKKHASETEQASIPDWWYDAIVRNEGSLEQFRASVTTHIGWQRFGVLDSEVGPS